MSEQQSRSDDERRRRREDADRFAGTKDEDLPSREVTEGPDKAPHRAMFRAMGFDDEDLSSPIVGVPNPAADITPCNVHLDDVADAALDGIDAAGGMPIEFGTITISDAISMGTEGMKASLISREVIADSVECSRASARTRRATWTPTSSTTWSGTPAPARAPAAACSPRTRWRRCRRRSGSRRSGRPRRPPKTRSATRSRSAPAS